MSDPNNPNNPNNLNKNVLKNTLLDELDNKQKTPNNQKITQKFKERLDSHPSRQELENFIKKVNDDFYLHNYGSPDVAGWNSFDILKSKTIESADPNKFMDDSIYVQHN